MEKKFDWEPSYGFCSTNRKPNEVLAAALEKVRRKICAYNMGTKDHDVPCDCKYGVDISTGPYSEKNGCPELRETIYRLLHDPESFGE